MWAAYARVQNVIPEYFTLFICYPFQCGATFNAEPKHLPWFDRCKEFKIRSVECKWKYEMLYLFRTFRARFEFTFNWNNVRDKRLFGKNAIFIFRSNFNVQIHLKYYLRLVGFYWRWNSFEQFEYWTSKNWHLVQRLAHADIDADNMLHMLQLSVSIH